MAPEPAAEGGQVHQRGPLRGLAGALPPTQNRRCCWPTRPPPGVWWRSGGGPAALVQLVRFRLVLPAWAVVVQHDLLQALGTLSRVRPCPTSPSPRRAGADACASRSPRRTTRMTSERAGGGPNGVPRREARLDIPAAAARVTVVPGARQRRVRPRPGPGAGRGDRPRDDLDAAEDHRAGAARQDAASCHVTSLPASSW